MRLNCAIVFVSDMDSSVAFYQDVFGLPLKVETPEWTEFSTAGATLPCTKRKEGVILMQVRNRPHQDSADREYWSKIWTYFILRWSKEALRASRPRKKYSGLALLSIWIRMVWLYP